MIKVEMCKYKMEKVRGFIFDNKNNYRNETAKQESDFYGIL